ncbi:MAG: M14 family zinc carboxypeptidase [Hyphomonadaceae bacterium]
MILLRAVVVLCVMTVPAFAQTPICESRGVSVSVDFEGGGRHTCSVAEDGEILLGVVPEGMPINASPWYAFRLDPASPAHVQVTLDYGDYTHRYAPHISTDGRNWTDIAAARVQIMAEGHRVRLSLDLPSGGHVIAAQPIETAAATHAWAGDIATTIGLEAVTYGASVDGAPLVAYRGGEGSLIVALTRQHPPETTGALAFRAFVERLAADDAEATAFRAAHRLLLAPLPNPDGVRHGHWRWNNAGMDLNRDWRDFSQPETRALRDLIQDEAAPSRAVVMLDFHSTQRNSIYAPPLDADAIDIDFLLVLRTHLDAAITDPPRWSYSHGEDGVTAKRWALSALHAPGLTIEIADDASDEEARLIGRTVAEAVIAYGAQ